MSERFIFTSGSVTEGHPDKLCDQISDALVDGFLFADPYAGVNAECTVAKGILFVALRFNSSAAIEVAEIARRVIERVGYTEGSFQARDCNIMTSVLETADDHPRREEKELSDRAIARIPAEHQVTVFGFACEQSPALMPLPIWLAHKLAQSLAKVRQGGEIACLAPDGQVQVAVEYQGRRPRRIHAINLVTATWDGPDVAAAELESSIRRQVIDPVFADEKIAPDRKTDILVNPSGPYLTGGPERHAGLTGRKTAIDTYGDYARHGGAALSGKDPSRIDRTGAYAARYAAKNVVAAGLAEECEVALSYAIGRADPVSLHVETFGTNRIPNKEIAGRLKDFFDFRPAAIVAQFDLRHLPALSNGPFYERLAAYGQVGRDDMPLPWERTDRAEDLMN